MKIIKLAVLLGMILLLSSAVQSGDREFYQIKIYTLENESQELRMDEYLKNAYLPAIHRAGISKVGVFKPVPGDEQKEKQIYVFIPFTSMAEFEQLDRKLLSDKNYQKKGSDYINAAYDNAPYKRIESILLRSFKSFPNHGKPDHKSSHDEMVYELRSYQSATEKIYEKKVEMFNEGKEAELFINLGFQPLFFGEVLSGADMPNLMYMITFNNAESQKKHWDAFVNSDEWNMLKGDPQYANTVSHIDKVLLHPTDYSDL